MTEQETREKIVGIITHEYVTDKDYAYIFDPRIEEKINNMADALIAAGIGDVIEYKHRAEVGERALHNCCFNMIYAPFGVVVRPTVDELYKAHLERAKKELQEERKDD